MRLSSQNTGEMKALIERQEMALIRLRNELHIAQEWSARVIAGRDQDTAEITDLRAENERLRAALEWFADEYDRQNFMRSADMHSTECRCLRCARDNARAALEGKA